LIPADIFSSDTDTSLATEVARIPLFISSLKLRFTFLLVAIDIALIHNVKKVTKRKLPHKR